MISAHQHLCVDNQVNAEDEHSEAGVDGVHDTVAWEEDANEADHRKDKQHAEHKTVGKCEINFCLESEQGQTENECCSDKKSSEGDAG